MAEEVRVARHKHDAVYDAVEVAEEKITLLDMTSLHSMVRYDDKLKDYRFKLLLFCFFNSQKTAFGIGVVSG